MKSRSTLDEALRVFVEREVAGAGEELEAAVRDRLVGGEPMGDGIIGSRSPQTSSVGMSAAR